MKKQLTTSILATFLLQTFAVSAYAGEYHDAKRAAREAAEARHERYKASRDAFFGDRSGARVHAHEANREEYRALKHEDRL
jgi:hypothetical protein